MWKLAPLLLATGCSFTFSRDPAKVPLEEPLACGGAFSGVIDALIGFPMVISGSILVVQAARDKFGDLDPSFGYVIGVPFTAVGAAFVASAIYGFRNQAKCTQLQANRRQVAIP
jgi:hypothetical protein